jgi:hypothetical protein
MRLVERVGDILEEYPGSGTSHGLGCHIVRKQPHIGLVTEPSITRVPGDLAQDAQFGHPGNELGRGCKAGSGKLLGFADGNDRPDK